MAIRERDVRAAYGETSLRPRHDWQVLSSLVDKKLPTGESGAAFRANIPLKGGRLMVGQTDTEPDYTVPAIIGVQRRMSEEPELLFTVVIDSKLAPGAKMGRPVAQNFDFPIQRNQPDQFVGFELTIRENLNPTLVGLTENNEAIDIQTDAHTASAENFPAVDRFALACAQAIQKKPLAYTL